MPTTAVPGAHLVAQFTSSHDHFPRYHELAMALAEAARTDARASEQLRHVIEQYVHHLHLHHTAEEIELFPAIQRTAPELADSIETLLSQHEQLAAQLDVVTTRLATFGDAAIGTTERQAAFDSLVDALATLSDVVTLHLEFEESTTVPVISSWADWPF